MEAYVIGKGGNPRPGKAALPKLHPGRRRNRGLPRQLELGSEKDASAVLPLIPGLSVFCASPRRASRGAPRPLPPRRTASRRRVTDRFDVVFVGIEHEGAVTTAATGMHSAINWRMALRGRSLKYAARRGFSISPARRYQRVHGCSGKREWDSARRCSATAAPASKGPGNPSRGAFSLLCRVDDSS